MAVQSFLSRVTTYTYSNVETARNRAQAARFGQIDERRYLRSPITARFELGWQDNRGWQKQTQASVITQNRPYIIT